MLDLLQEGSVGPIACAHFAPSPHQPPLTVYINGEAGELFSGFPASWYTPLVGSATDDPLDDPVQGVDRHNDDGDVEEKRERNSHDDARPREAAPTQGKEGRNHERPRRSADEF